MKTGRPSKYPKLDNKEWLYEQYVTQGLSTCQIADNIGVKEPKLIGYRLKKYGIPRRNLSLSHTHNRPDLVIPNKDVIDGALLGDGCLEKRNRKTNVATPLFSQASSMQEYVKYLAGLLWDGDGNGRIRKYNFKSFGKINTAYKFTTKNSNKLSKYFSRWYPDSNKNIKLIPRDIMLTPTVLLHWFMGDGTTSYRKGRPKKQRILVLCSESFSYKDNLWLKNSLMKKFGLIFYLRRNGGKGTDWRLAISANHIDKFLDIIGPPPIKCMAYKWKRAS